MSTSRTLGVRAALLLAACALACAVPAAGAAQGRTHSLEDVAFMLTGATPEQVMQRFQSGDCISFIVDRAAEERLRRAGADSAFVAALKQECYLGTELAITTEPAGAEVILDGRTVGRSPYRIPIAPRSGVIVGAKAGAWVRTSPPVTLVPNVRTRIHFVVPEDTLPWPRGRSALELGQQFGLLDGWESKLPRPQLPPPPSGWSKLKRLTIGAALLGGAAYAASLSRCKVIDPAYVVDSVTYPAMELGVDPNCSGAYAAGGAVAGALLTAGWSKMRHGSRVRAYERARREFSITLNGWEQEKARERIAWLEAQPRVRAALDEQATRLAPELDRVRRENARIVERNRRIAAAPTTTTENPTIFPRGRDREATIFLADVDTAIPRARAQNARAVAVVIGNRVYSKRDMPGVDYAARDADAMKRYLVQAFGFREEHIIDERNATLATLRTIFGTEANERGRLYDQVAYNAARGDSVDVFVFYSGHGAPGTNDKQGYLVPSDADPNRMEYQGYPLTQLHRNLAKLPARSVMLVLDACFSGRTEKGQILTGVSGGILRLENPFLAIENGTLFAAAQSDQVSSWYDEKRHGLFTYYFLKGIQGAADADGNREITAREMDEYLTPAVRSLARLLKQREQNPVYVGRDPSRVIASLQATTVRAGER